ncbi:unnamed protein product, partial [Candidula unifasciata]
SPGLSAVHYVPLVVFPILLLQGIVGNILAIPILISVSRSAWSTVMYLACLAVTDLVILLIRCGSTWYKEAVGVDVSRRIISSSDAACKAYYFSFVCVQHINPWIVVAMSVDLMIATRWPRRTYIMCTLERARHVLLLIGILVVCLDISHFWTYGVPKPGLDCMYTEEFSDLFKNQIWPAMDNTFGTVLPLAAVSTCFGITARTLLRRSPTLIVEEESEMKKYFLELAALKDFKMICFILCLIFIFLGLCKISYILLTLLDSLAYIEIDCVTRELFDTLNMTFTFLFYGAKIYIYIAFSSMFREKLKFGFFKTIRKLEFFCKKICRCSRKWTLVPPKDKSQETGSFSGQKRHSSYIGSTSTTGDITLYQSSGTETTPQIFEHATASCLDSCENVDNSSVNYRNWNQSVPENSRDQRTWEDVQIAGSGTNV